MRARHTTGRPLWMTGAIALVALLLVSFESGTAQTSWPFHLEWDHPGPGGVTFRLCVDGTCVPLAASRTSGEGWRSPLPRLSQGEHRLVVEACRGTDCVPGEPDLFVRVAPASARRPPIDIIDGPRIPLNRP